MPYLGKVKEVKPKCECELPRKGGDNWDRLDPGISNMSAWICPNCTELYVAYGRQWLNGYEISNALGWRAAHNAKKLRRKYLREMRNKT